MIVECLPLFAYTEKRVLPRSGPFSQVLPQIARVNRPAAGYTYCVGKQHSTIHLILLTHGLTMTVYKTLQLNTR